LWVADATVDVCAFYKFVWILSLFASIGAAHQIANATAVIVSWRPDSIRIAADSKQSHFLASPTTSCKITQTREVVFAVVGLTYYRPTQYSAASALTPIFFSRGEPFDLKAAKAIRKMTLVLEKTFRYQQDQDPRAYAKYHRGDGVVLSLVMAAIENGIPRMLIADFQYVPEKRAIAYVVKACPQQCTSSQNFFLGFTSASKFYLTNHPPTPVNLKKAIKREASRSPDDVGAPIAVIELTPQSTRWHSRGACH
jgi:hypothetical protein